MFVKSFVTSFGDALYASRSQGLLSHLRKDWVRHTRGACRSLFEVNQLRRVGKMVARIALRIGYVGNPLTPTGYAILAITVAAIVLVAMLSISSVGDELNGALRLSWWFS